MVLWCVVCMLSHVQLFATLWTIARQSPLSMEFSKQEYWSGLPFPIPGDLPDLGVKPMSLALAGEFFTTEPSGKPIKFLEVFKVIFILYVCNKKFS